MASQTFDPLTYKGGQRRDSAPQAMATAAGTTNGTARRADIVAPA